MATGRGHAADGGKAHAGLLKEPPPFVLQKSLGDFCVTYELNAYTSSAGDMAEKYHALHANIQDVFNEYGVQIMTPAYEGGSARNQRSCRRNAGTRNRACNLPVRHPGHEGFRLSGRRLTAWRQNRRPAQGAG